MANFAAAGNSNGKGLPDWTPVSAQSAATMQLGDAPGSILIAASPARIAL
jgi:hypothetical protein